MVRLLLLLALVGGILLWLQPRRRPAAVRWAKTLLWLGAALLYLRLPFDLIPDVGPVGFLDDLVVLGLSLWFGRRSKVPDWLRRSEEARTRPRHDAAPPPADERLDPYQVLEITPSATAEEIAHAYRTQMKRYHPDRVEGLGPELRAVAHRKTQEIQRAYDELRRHR